MWTAWFNLSKRLEDSIMTAIIARRSFSHWVLIPLVLSFALGLVGTGRPAGAGVPIYIDFEGIAIQGV